MGASRRVDVVSPQSPRRTRRQGGEGIAYQRCREVEGSLVAARRAEHGPRFFRYPAVSPHARGRPVSRGADLIMGIAEVADHPEGHGGTNRGQGLSNTPPCPYLRDGAQHAGWCPLSGGAGLPRSGRWASLAMLSSGHEAAPSTDPPLRDRWCCARQEAFGR